MIYPNLFFYLFLIFSGIGMILSILLPMGKRLQALGWTGGSSALTLIILSGLILAAGGNFRLFHLQIWRFGIDPFSAWFILITGLVFLPVSIFLTEHKKKAAGNSSLKSFGILYHALLLFIPLVFMARNILCFLIVWEITAVLSYFLVHEGDEQGSSAQAGYFMLVFSEAGFFAFTLAFLLIAARADSLNFAAMEKIHLSADLQWVVFLLSFIGFGIKAGILPFNLWIPRTYKQASEPFPLISSGTMTNLGIYGILLINLKFAPLRAPGPGLVLLVFGAVTAFLGIVYAAIEKDLQEMLAHSTIENMGIALCGFGAGFVFLAEKFPVLAAIAFTAGFYHLLNHSIYKSLLFMGTGNIISKTGVQNSDKLGGLIKSMPWTAAFFLIGSLAISAIPPFNGFVSEWLTLQSLLQSFSLESHSVKLIFALSGALLALTAALAATCFVKGFGMNFLGVPRSLEAEKSHEAGKASLFSMGFLALLCLFLGIAPTYVIPVISRMIQPYVSASSTQALVPNFFHPKSLNPGFVSTFHSLGAQVGRSILPGRGLVVLHQGLSRNPVVFAMSTSYGFLILLFLLGIAFGIVWIFTRQRKVSRKEVWAGGIRSLVPEMTYTASGFSNPVSVIFQGILHPTQTKETREEIAEHFRTAIRIEKPSIHLMDYWIITPFSQGLKFISMGLGKMHTGKLNAYAAYIFITLLILLFLAR